ncbi:MAG: AsmA family protein [Rhodospirillaceae bacterium]
MKRFGAITFGVVILLLVGVLITPSFIDWTPYRKIFESRISAITGREVTVEGDLSFSFLPRPALNMKAVRIGSIDGAINSDFTIAEAVNVNLAFRPLLVGGIQFTSVELVRPLIFAEVLPDGRNTWTLNPSLSVSIDGARLSDSNTSFDLRIDSLTVIDGELIYNNATDDPIYAVSGFNADITAESINGPYAAHGEARVAGVNWTFQGTVGAPTTNGLRTVAVDMDTANGNIQSRFSGQMAPSLGMSSVSGRLALSGTNATEGLASFGFVVGDSLARALSRPYELAAKVDFAESSARVSNIELRSDEVRLSGAGEAKWGESHHIELSLKASRLDLESWLTGGLDRIVDTPFFDFDAATTANTLAEGEVSYVLPRMLSARLNFGIDLIEWNGQVMRNGLISVSLQEGELAIKNASLDLPGNSHLSFSGSVKNHKGGVFFDLKAVGQSRNARSLLSWLEFDLPDGLATSGRMNALSFESQIIGTPSDIKLKNIQAVLDTTRLTGTANLARAERLQLGLDINVNQLDLDSYAPGFSDRLFSIAHRAEDIELVSTTQPNDKTSTLISKFPIDVSITASLGSVVVAGKSVEGMLLSANTTPNGVLVKNFSLSNFAGASLQGAGLIKSFSPVFSVEDFKVQAKTNDFYRLVRALNANVPIVPLLSASINLQGEITGTPSSLSLNAEGRAGDLVIKASGTLSDVFSGFDQGLSFEIKASADHPSYSSFLSGLNMDRNDDSILAEASSLSVNAVGGDSLITLNSLLLNVGVNGVEGNAIVDLSGVQPQVTGSLHVLDLNVDDVIPKDSTARLMRSSLARGTNNSGDVSGRWSSAPIDLSVISKFDGTLNLTAKSLSGWGVLIENLEAPITLQDSTLSITKWSGDLFGGPSNGDFTITVGETHQIQTRMDVVDAELNQNTDDSASSAFMSFSGKFSSSGQSQQELVSNLSGGGVLKTSDLDARATSENAVIAAALVPVRALSQLGGLVTGNRPDGSATLESAFNVSKGVATLDEASLTSNVYAGEFTGTIDLPRWTIDAQGRIRLQSNTLAKLTNNRVQLPALIPIEVFGSLDAPNVRLNASGGLVAN